MPDDLRAQIEPLREIVRALGWPLLMVDGVEADDVIGTLARRRRARRHRRRSISTGDKDFAQLVRPGVTLVNTMSDRRSTRPACVAKFGVRADQIVDLPGADGRRDRQHPRRRQGRAEDRGEMARRNTARSTA